ncbi:MAG: hypothetical protein HZY76_17620 [Anaerolineae bacterium]|nr:MAG: hypothetical protein HZY76_17620 [Anaerolineae bacterium]
MPCEPRHHRAPAAEAAAVEERRAAPTAEVVRRLEVGTLLVAVADPLDTLLPAWEAQPPIWVRHVHPVQVSLPCCRENRVWRGWSQPPNHWPPCSTRRSHLPYSRAWWVRDRGRRRAST